MNTDLLREEFRKILDYEKRAENFYNHYIDQVDNKEIKEKLISIRDDETEHIKIAEKLIDLVS